MTDDSPPAGGSRRRFLKIATCALGGGIGATVVVPAAQYLLYPVGRRTVTTGGEPIDALAAERMPARRAADPGRPGRAGPARRLGHGPRRPARRGLGPSRRRRRGPRPVGGVPPPGLRGRLRRRAQPVQVPVPRQHVRSRRRPVGWADRARPRSAAAHDRARPDRDHLGPLPGRRTRPREGLAGLGDRQATGRLARRAHRVARRPPPRPPRAHPRRRVVGLRLRLGAGLPPAPADDHRRPARVLLQPVVDRRLGLGRPHPGPGVAGLAGPRPPPPRRLGDGDRRRAAPPADRELRRLSPAARGQLDRRRPPARPGHGVRPDRLPPALGPDRLLGDQGRDRDRGLDPGARRAPQAGHPGRQRVRQPDPDPVLRAPRLRPARAHRRAGRRPRRAVPQARRDPARRPLGRRARRGVAGRSGPISCSATSSRWPMVFAAMLAWTVHVGGARLDAPAESVGGVRRPARVVLPLAAPAAQVLQRHHREGGRARRAGRGRRLPPGAAVHRSRGAGPAAAAVAAPAACCCSCLGSPDHGRPDLRVVRTRTLATTSSPRGAPTPRPGPGRRARSRSPARGAGGGRRRGVPDRAVLAGALDLGQVVRALPRRQEARGARASAPATTRGRGSAGS